MVRCLCGRNHEEETCIEDRRLEDQKRCYSNAMFKSDNEHRGALGHRRNHEEEEACKEDQKIRRSAIIPMFSIIRTLQSDYVLRGALHRSTVCAGEIKKKQSSY